MKFFSPIVFAALVLLGISSCKKKENYPITPAITFKNIIHYTPGDSLAVQINFTDGDGDIGTSDTGAPYNCYLEFLLDSVNVFVPQFTSNPMSKVTTGDTVVYAYHIPYITPAGSDKSLNGMIQIQLLRSVWCIKGFDLGATIEFRVWIIDRAGHISNRITTSAIAVPSS
jgi:hypothetical protein